MNHQTEPSTLSSSLKVDITSPDIPSNDPATKRPADVGVKGTRTQKGETGQLPDYHIPRPGFAFSGLPGAEAFLLLIAVAIAWTAAWGYL
jgi:hypothetical protein